MVPAIRLLLFLLITLNVGLGHSREMKAKNIFYRTIDNTIEIFYDLPFNADIVQVTVYFRKKSQPALKYKLTHASGNIGLGVFSGEKQKVIWRYKEEPAFLFTGAGFYYQIVIRKKSLRKFK